MPLFAALIALTAASICTPTLPPANETLKYIMINGGLSFTLQLPQDCYILASNGARIDYNYANVGVYRDTIVEWMKAVRGNITHWEPTEWLFTCEGHSQGSQDSFLVVIRWTGGSEKPPSCSLKIN